MSTADVAVIAEKCSTLMASDVHCIALFTPEFMNKLNNCAYPFIFKMYMLPYMNWFDCSLLKRLVIFAASKEAILMVDKFVDSLDYSKPVTSYHIPEVSQLLIPLDTSDYTLLATLHVKDIDELTLQDVLGIKKTLISTLEISDYAVQLSAVHIKSRCFYWLIPRKLRPLIEGKLNQNQLKLRNEGIIFLKLLSINFLSEELTNENENDLNFFNINHLHEVLLICVHVFTYYLYACIYTKSRPLYRLH